MTFKQIVTVCRILPPRSQMHSDDSLSCTPNACSFFVLSLSLSILLRHFPIHVHTVNVMTMSDFNTENAIAFLIWLDGVSTRRCPIKSSTTVDENACIWQILYWMADTFRYHMLRACYLAMHWLQYGYIKIFVTSMHWKNIQKKTPNGRKQK